MAEYHTSLGVASSQDIMQAIYTHVSNVSCPLTFANDTGTVAVHNGTSFGTPTGASWWGTGSYMVIEGPHPDGEVWQIRLIRAASNNITSQCAPLGGWTTSGFGSSLVGAVGTAQVGSSLVASGDELWISSSVGEDTYNSGTYDVSYLRILWFDDSASVFANGIYIGGYIPLDETDGQPFVMFRGVPSSADSSANWGSDSSTSNTSETWGDGVHSSLTWATGWGLPSIITCSTDFNGSYPTARVHVQAAISTVLGYIGNNAFRNISTGVVSRTLAVGSNYMGGRGFVHKWAP